MEKNLISSYCTLMICINTSSTKCLLKESMKTKPVNEPVWFGLGVFVTSDSHSIPDSVTVAARISLQMKKLQKQRLKAKRAV